MVTDVSVGNMDLNKLVWKKQNSVVRLLLVLAGLPLINFVLSYAVFNVLAYFYAAAGKTMLFLLYRVVLTLIELTLVFYVVYPFLKLEKQSPTQMIGYKKEKLLSDIGIGILLATAAFAVNFVYAPIGDRIDPGYEQSTTDYFSSQPAVLKVFDSTAIPITAGFVEELTWRGYGYGVFSTITGNAVFAALVSSISFGLVHSQLYVVGFGILYGLVYCFAFEKTKRLMPLMIGHWLYDFIQFVALLIAFGF